MAAAGVKTACPYCGVGCGVSAIPQADGSIAIAGDPDHPAKFGRLCSKGSAPGETLSLDDRLLTPIIDGGRSDWQTALDLVASRFSRTIAEHGPDSVAFYVSGQLLIEDYYVANKLMKGFIGSANIDTNSRLCMASSVAGHRRAFGSDTAPGLYDDLEEADCVVLVGSNLAWRHPVLFQRLMAAREKQGARLVVIHPRATAASEATDLHLSLAPGSDVALFAGLPTHLDRAGAVDRTYVEAHTRGLDSALNEAQAFDLDRLATITDMSRAKLVAFLELFAKTERVVTVYSQGVNQSSAGTDKVNATINCRLATGQHRFVGFEDGRLAGVFFVAREPVAAAPDFLAEQLGRAFAPADRLRLLAGRPGGEARDRGPMVCACFDVGRNEILAAAAMGCRGVAAIGERLDAGTNCGSRRTEIARLLEPAAKTSMAT